MSSALALNSEAAEVVLGEAQAVRTMVQDEGRRTRLADLIAAAQEGEVSEDDLDALAELLELGLQTGRIRSIYGPAGEQAAVRVFRRLPQGREIAESARDVSAALGLLVGRRLEKLEIGASAPGAFLLTVSVDGQEFGVRLDRQGARLTSVGL